MGQFALHRDGSRPVAEARAQPDFFILRPQYRSVLKPAGYAFLMPQIRERTQPHTSSLFP
jgi:hypothetical protein